MNPLIFNSAFIFSLLCHLLTPLVFPLVKLSYFSPFIVLALYKKNQTQFLNYCLIAGFILDLLSTTPFGFWTINYLVCGWLLLYIKPFFFQDKLMTLPLVTLLFSQISTLFYALATHLFFQKFNLNIYWIMTDLVVYPIFDAIFAVAAYTFPMRFLKKWLPKKRRHSRSFRLNEE